MGEGGRGGKGGEVCALAWRVRLFRGRATVQAVVDGPSDGPSGGPSGRRRFDPQDLHRLGAAVERAVGDGLPLGQAEQGGAHRCQDRDAVLAPGRFVRCDECGGVPRAPVVREGDPAAEPDEGRAAAVGGIRDIGAVDLALEEVDDAGGLAEMGEKDVETPKVMGGDSDRRRIAEHRLAVHSKSSISKGRRKWRPFP
ncbi:protein of unknown function [Azospirillum baldaniorum]|uniref:Uncharacterized protein n=1 Tax=Azospirillum baldaniorum TaxID=1064539 RepID=A0A9P1NLN1_9PROT|nr:protein of unknown function [Azospirillum baldaniorum]